LFNFEQTAGDEDVEDGYPTELALKKITEWSTDDLPGLFDFLKSIWWAADWGWHEEDTPDGKRTRYNISTAGWSGNEDAIRAFGDNVCAWSMAWQSMRRGGHYVFEIRKKAAASQFKGKL
jgi:hypothetical protein